MFLKRWKDSRTHEEAFEKLSDRCAEVLAIQEALLDAIWRAISETGARIAAIEETQRTGLVAFVIITDGAENYSKECTRSQIREMIEHQQSVYKWQFTFLATNQDALSEGASTGIVRESIAESSRGKVRGTYDAASRKMARMRRAVGEGIVVNNGFTDEERGEML